ncbi:MAG TPA: TetR/AcrR family transcriptional regulator [bacterium]|jgi:AcrR family transcriptional regulator|nr:TetR/AcrR family transcriptional regulator [bacterium]
MKAARIDVGSIRREQIVDAAIAVIAEQGIQHLSLSEIEKKTGLVRGQLTYYYKTKEDILLAVFDRLIEQMHRRATAADSPAHAFRTMPPGWERACQLLTFILLQRPMRPEFSPLQYTFLSQIGHREDFRARLAKLYEEWRAHMAEDFAAELTNKTGKRVDPRLLASLVQAILHGLAIQRAADPEAFNQKEMLDLMIELVGGYLRPPAPAKKRRPARHGTGNGKTRQPSSSTKG